MFFISTEDITAVSYTHLDVYKRQARMSLLLRRAPYQQFLTDQSYANMMKIEDCRHCNACRSRCPYGLDTPSLLQENLADYKQFYQEHR